VVILLLSGARKIAMTEQKDDEQIRREFELRRLRQLLAIAATFIFLLMLALISNRPDIFGEFARNDILATQILLLASFVGFSAFNWKCPSCKTYLGPDIGRRVCKQCGTRLR
jgi:hypothetical protein